jgi:hypothetical protein
VADESTVRAELKPEPEEPRQEPAVADRDA